MAKKKNQIIKTGLPLGSIIYTGENLDSNVLINHYQYDSDNLLKYSKTQDSFELNQKIGLTEWYDIRGLGNIKFIEKLGSKFDIHNLILEELVDVHQRAKYEEFENGSFLIFKALTFDEKALTIDSEQISIFFSENLVVSFQEFESDLFESIRIRIQNNKGRIRHKKADYLVIALIDFVCDQYFTVFDKVENVIEEIESELLNNPDIEGKARIHKLKKELLHSRKKISALREALNRFSRSESSILKEENEKYLNSVYNQCIQILDTVESYRDLLNGLQELLLSEMSFKMNRIMQVLTIITTLFIPLSFLTGLYGMNFELIPELKYENGYFVLLAIMASIFIIQVYLFRKYKWF